MGNNPKMGAKIIQNKFYKKKKERQKHIVELSGFIQKIGALAHMDDHIQIFEIYHCIKMKGILMGRV